MKTVGELREALANLNPGMEINILSKGYTNIQVRVAKQRCCDGPYLVCEIFNKDEDEE